MEDIQEKIIFAKRKVSAFSPYKITLAKGFKLAGTPVDIFARVTGLTISDIEGLA